MQYVDLNTGWLITGEGEMLKKNEQKNEISNSNINLLLTMLKEKDDEIIRLRNENDELKQKIAHLDCVER
jgi:hypothetical protein